MKKAGRKRLATLLIRTSRGQFREAKADKLLAAADETSSCGRRAAWTSPSWPRTSPSRFGLIKAIDVELAAIEDRIDVLYDDADPAGIVVSAPGLGVTLAAGILGRTGDLNRFASLAGVRAFTGLVPKIDQSGTTDTHQGLTKAGDPGLRTALFLAADQARKVDPTLAARYHRLFVEQGRGLRDTIDTAVVGDLHVADRRPVPVPALRGPQLHAHTITDQRTIASTTTKVVCPRFRTRQNTGKPLTRTSASRTPLMCPSTVETGRRT